MKLISSESGKFVFQIGDREKLLFAHLLGLYPVIEKPYQPLSKTADSEAIRADQELLDQAMVAEKREHKKAVEKLFNTPGVFTPQDHGSLLTLDSQHMEWLLQVLNDIRVGSWRRLGSPEDLDIPQAPVDSANLQYAWAMQVSGLYQSILIGACNGTA